MDSLENYLVEEAKRGAKFNIEIQKINPLDPTVLIFTPNKEIKAVLIHSENKEKFAEILNNVLVTEQAESYVLIMEGASTTFIEAAKRYNNKVLDMPVDDRFDVVSILSTTRNSNVMTQHIARITADSSGDRNLNDLWETALVEKGQFYVIRW